MTLLTNCTTCLFKRKNPATLVESWVCARNPPQGLMLMGQDPLGNPVPAGVIIYRPGVTDKDWCGEYKIAPSIINS